VSIFNQTGEHFWVQPVKIRFWSAFNQIYDSIQCL